MPTGTPIAARFAAMLHDRHPGIVPSLRSMRSVELETGLKSLALDLGLGDTERMDGARSLLRVCCTPPRGRRARCRAALAFAQDPGLAGSRGTALGLAAAKLTPEQR